MADIKRAVAGLLLCCLTPALAVAQSQDDYDTLRERLDPAFGFMAGHYSNDYRPAKAVVVDIANYGFLARARPFHEVVEMLEGYLANDG